MGCGNDVGSNNLKKKRRKENRITERKSWKALHSRFPRIATFAAWIRLRNAPGSAYADPSAHISGIVHSCPHLGYLNYICNVYRAMSARNTQALHDVVVVAVEGPTYVRLLIGETHVRMYSRGFVRVCVLHTRSRGRAASRRRSLRVAAPVLSDSGSFARARGRTRELVTTRCAP